MTLAGVAGNKPVKCSRDVTIVPDTSLESALTKGPYDAIVCPGGAGGAKILSQVPKDFVCLKKRFLFLFFSLAITVINCHFHHQQ